MINAMIIDEKDDVIIAIEEIKAGDTVFFIENQQEKSLIAITDVTIYHKIAKHDILKGNPINKYGEHIGIAGCDIKAGEHMHLHNIEERREDLK